jgi:hypothetical protein
MNPIISIIDYFKRLRVPKKQEIIEYYPRYLLSHKNPINKLLHIFGNVVTLIFIIIVCFYSQINLLLLLLLFLTPFVVYCSL